VCAWVEFGLIQLLMLLTYYNLPFLWPPVLWYNTFLIAAGLWIQKTLEDRKEGGIKLRFECENSLKTCIENQKPLKPQRQKTDKAYMNEKWMKNSITIAWYICYLLSIIHTAASWQHCIGCVTSFPKHLSTVPALWNLHYMSSTQMKVTVDNGALFRTAQSRYRQTISLSL